jgi:hypothetical protein
LKRRLKHLFIIPLISVFVKPFFFMNLDDGNS